MHKARGIGSRASLPAGVLALACLAVGSVWEYLFHHDHEQALQVFGVFLVLMWGAISYVSTANDRERIERAFFVVFLGLAACMALFPHLLQPAPEVQAVYRGVPRWRGWCLDCNNAGVVFGLAAVIALRLRGEVPGRFSRGLILLAALFGLQLVRSYSRVGLLTAVVALALWLAPKWREVPRNCRALTASAATGLLLVLPFVAPALHGSRFLPLRRAASFTNVMDLSWANRLYVLPGCLQAALDRPFSGWGWGRVLPVHRKIFCPTFLRDNTAILLNDYAHLAASYGLLLVLVVVLLLGWCLIRSTRPYARMVVASLSVAMFFQGVVRIPLTMVPLCMSVGLLLGETASRRGCPRSRQCVPVPLLVAAAVFVAAWVVAPLLLANKWIRCDGETITVSGTRDPAITIALLQDGDMFALGREARAAASLGVRVVIAHSDAVQDIRGRYGTNVWTVDSRSLPDTPAGETGFVRGVAAVRRVYDAGGSEAPPTPDKPYPLKAVVVSLYACALLFLIWELAVNSPRPLLVGGGAACVSAMCLFGHWTSQDWRRENGEVAEWARQMRRDTQPDDVARDYVLSPEIAPGFVIHNRAEVWHTFYQVSASDDTRELLGRVKEAMDVQFLVRPDDAPLVRPFEKVWRTRTCSLTERPYVLAAILRTLNVPARVHGGQAEYWMAGQWRLATPGRVPTGPA
jgi:O-antigen ligase